MFFVVYERFVNFKSVFTSRKRFFYLPVFYQFLWVTKTFYGNSDHHVPLHKAREPLQDARRSSLDGSKVWVIHGISSSSINTPNLYLKFSVVFASTIYLLSFFPLIHQPARAQYLLNYLLPEQNLSHFYPLLRVLISISLSRELHLNIPWWSP